MNISTNPYSTEPDISSLLYHCENYGCTVKLHIEIPNILQHHAKTCPFQILQCPDCGQEIPRFQLHLHRVNACPFRKLYCHLCGSGISAADIHYHLETHISCPECSAHIISPEDIPNHQLVACTFCKAPIHTCQMPRHLLSQHSLEITDRSAICPLELVAAERAIQKITWTTTPVSTRAHTIHVDCRMMRFSPEHKGAGIKLLEGGRALKRFSDLSHLRWRAALLNHPGFTSGVHRWVFGMVSSHIACFGVSPPGLDLRTILHSPFYPGSHLMPGSVGFGDMGIGPRVCCNGGQILGGFRYTKRSKITLELDMDERTVSWTRSGDAATTFSRPLPLSEGAYVPAVGVSSRKVVRILSYTCIE
eukprot:gnl/Dysnectes_brevis/8562_a15309_238.p1 GENE.gnl/Dysnectes_brevis/8562_a15309_238~~gnl/Dysnectes_brevis/8562_a15309_238.p1  ORF type:complete len:362 (+),score=32.01 gnl/Dysnectes_brevis/8562_a15309_238:210-1295(+)